MKSRGDSTRRLPFVRVVWKMVGLSLHTSPGAYVLFLMTSLIFTALLIADLHLIRVLLDDLPLFSEGKLEYGAVLVTVILLGGVSIIDTLMNASMNFLYEYLERRTTGRMTEMMSEKAARLDFIQFESAQLFDQIERATNGRVRGFEAMEQVVFSLIFHGGYFLFLAVYLIWFEPLLVLGVFVSFLPVAVSRFIRASAFYNVENRVAPLRREYAHYEACMTDRLFFKETRTSGAVLFFRRLYGRALGAYNREMWRTELRTGVVDLSLKCLTLAGYVGLLLLMVFSVLRSDISPGLFGAVYFAMDNIFKWFEELFDRLGAAYENAALGGNFLAFLDLPERVRRKPGAQGGSHELARDRGVTLENVSFCYPGQDEVAVDNVSLSISPGQSLAIVGENGAGKSTLVRLISGMIVPDTGRVSVDGIDLKNVDSGAIHLGTSAVFQRYQRYRLTLQENVSISEYSCCSRHARDAVLFQ